MQYTSEVVEQAVEALSGFPGIGRRTALRLVMHLLKRPDMEVARMAEALLKLKTDLFVCKICNNVSDGETCQVCSNPAREASLICVVEDYSDQLAIESTGQYRGVYHILGGLISPMDGIGPEDIHVNSLLKRAEDGSVNEVIMALSATVEGDTTMYYLARKLKDYGVKTSCIARGIAVGGEIEYADEITLARSLQQRTPYSV